MNRRPALAHCTLQATAGQAAAAVSASPHCSTAALQSQLQQSTSAFLIWVKCAAAAASSAPCLSNVNLESGGEVLLFNSLLRRRLSSLAKHKPLPFFFLSLNQSKIRHSEILNHCFISVWYISFLLRVGFTQFEQLAICYSNKSKK